MQGATDLFDLMQRRLEWTGTRQAILAQNVANSDTPGYTPQDVAPFADLLHDRSISLMKTDLHHLSPKGGSLHLTSALAKERSPDGNAVSLESELVKMADTEQSQQLTLNLYSKYISLFLEATGKG